MSISKKSTSFGCVVALLLSPVFSSHSEELEPRSYTNIPIDQNFFAAVYAYTKGDVYVSNAIPVEDLTIEIDGPLLGYARTFSMFGSSAKFDMAVGQACAHATALVEGEPASRSWCGYTDAKFRLNYNFYNAPALTLAEYIKRPKQFVAGASLQVSAPTGNYDKDYVFNVGSHRWFFKPEIGMSFPIGQFEFDASFGIKFFTDNDEFQRTKTLEQDPVYNLQTHLVYDIAPGQWISLNANYFEGGDTYVDGERSGIKKGNYRAGLTYTFSFDAHHSVKLLANTGVTTRLGNDSDIVAVAYSYRWE